MQINCISSKRFEETRLIYSPSNNAEILMGSETDGIVEEFFELQRLQEARETANNRGSELIHENVGLSHYIFQKISLQRGGSHVDSPEWLKNKRATTNPKNKNCDNCFQYVITVVLNYQNIVRDYRGMSKIRPFINQDKWKEIGFPSHQKDWKKIEKDNMTIALNILYVPYNP